MPTAARAGALKDGRRPPPQAARSVLERPEHDAPIKNGGRLTIALAPHNGIYGLLTEGKSFLLLCQRTHGMNIRSATLDDVATLAAIDFAAKRAAALPTIIRGFETVYNFRHYSSKDMFCYLF
jgi:hypothetical protein